jgi:hypothetical protein
VVDIGWQNNTTHIDLSISQSISLSRAVPECNDMQAGLIVMLTSHCRSVSSSALSSRTSFLGQSCQP